MKNFNPNKYNAISKLYTTVDGIPCIQWFVGGGGLMQQEFSSVDERSAAVDQHMSFIEQERYLFNQATELEKIKARQRNREIANMFTIGEIIREKKAVKNVLPN